MLDRFGGQLSKGEYDARLMADTPKRRARRRFADEFKVGVVRLVLDDGMTVGGVTRAMDLAVTACDSAYSCDQLAGRCEGAMG